MAADIPAVTTPTGSWRDLPNTTTPVTAAELNERDTATRALITAINTGDVPDGFLAAMADPETELGSALAGAIAATPAGGVGETRRAVQTFGTSGTNGQANLSNVCVRVPLRLPVRTTRWRLRISNYNVRTGTAGATGHFFRGAWVGAHAGAGNFVAAPVNAIPDPGASGSPIPGTADPLLTPWVTAPDAQLGTVVENLVSMQINGATATVTRGYNAAYGSFGTADGGVQTVSTSAWNFTPWDIAIEYEFVTTDKVKRVGLYLGDSNIEGVGGDSGGTFQWQKLARLHALLSGGVDTNIGVSGIAASTFGVTGYRWDRVPWADIAPDYAVVNLGTNDANSNTNRSLVQYQADIRAIWAVIRARGVQTIYAVLPPPRTSFGVTTLSAAVAVGATTIQTAAAFNANDYIALNAAGATREVVQAASASTGSGPFTTTLVAATTLAHASGVIAQHNGQVLLEQYRAWLATGPNDVIPVDADVPLRDPARGWAILPEYTTDGTHLTQRGMASVAQRLALPA